MKKILFTMMFMVVAASAFGSEDCLNGDCSEGVTFLHECRGVSTDYTLEKTEKLEVYAENSSAAEMLAKNKITDSGREPLKMVCRNGWQNYSFD